MIKRQIVKELDSKMSQILESTDKKDLESNYNLYVKENRRKMDKMNQKVDYLNEEFKSVKNQVDILGLQNIESKIKISSPDFNNKLDTTENRMNELKDRPTGNIPTEAQKEK